MKNGIAIALTLVALSSCSEKVEIVHHEQQIESRLKTFDSVHFSEIENALNHLPLLELEEQMRNSPEESSEKIVALLEPHLMSKEIISKGALFDTRRNLRFLALFNAAIIERIRQKDPKVNNYSYLKRYFEIRNSACFLQIRNCSLVSDFRTREIFIAYAEVIDEKMTSVKNRPQKYSENLIEYYNVIHVVFDLVRAFREPKLIELFLRHSHQYSNVKGVNLSKHAKIFDLLLEPFIDIASQSPQSIETAKVILKNFSPWLFSKRNPGVFKKSYESILTLAAKLCIRPDFHESCSFDDAIKESQEVSGDALSFTAKLKRLKDEAPKIIKNLEINANIKKNDSFYLIDRMFNRHWTAKDASAVWNVIMSRLETDKERSEKEKEFLSKALDYLKVEMAYLVYETNVYMNSVYNENRTNLSSKELLESTIRDSREISEKWQLFANDKTGDIKGFVVNNMHSLKAAELDEFTNTLRFLKKNINLVSVNPNMQILAYFMVKYEFNIDIPTFWGSTIKHDYIQVISNLYSRDGIEPWFNFSGDLNPFKKYEVLTSFYYALMTGTFDVFLGENKEKIDEFSFFSNVLKSYLQQDEKDIDVAIRKLDDYLASNSWSDLESVCTSQNLEEFKTSIFFPNLTKYTLWGVGITSSPLSEAKPYDSDFIKPLTVIRTEVTKKLLLIDLMIKIYSGYLQNSMSDSSLVHKKTKKLVEEVSAVFEPTKRKIRSYYERMVKIDSTIDSCIYDLIKMDREQRAKIIHEEANHLGTVYDKMSQVQSLSTEQSTEKLSGFQSYLNHLSTEELPLEDKNLEKINKNFYSFSRLSLLGRISNHMKRISPNVSFTFPNLENHELYVNRRSDGEKIELRFKQDKDRFIKDGLLHFNGKTGNKFSWDVSQRAISFLSQKIQFLVELHLATEMGILELKDNAYGARRLITEVEKILNFLSLSPNELEANQLIRQTVLYHKEHLVGLFFQERNETASPIFDELYKRVSSELLYASEAKEFSEAYDRLGTFVFPPKTFFKTVAQEHFMPKVRKNFDLIENLEKEINRARLSINEDSAIIPFELSPSGEVVQAIDVRFDEFGNALLLSPVLTRDQQFFKKNFPIDTKGFFEH